MLTYHNDPAIKAKYLARVVEHRRQDHWRPIGLGWFDYALSHRGGMKLLGIKAGGCLMSGREFSDLALHREASRPG
jgi:hypothetical protein